jgi:hypothetical protein
MRYLRILSLFALLLASLATPAAAAGPTYDITTLAGKVASVNGTAGLQIRFSAFIEAEANNDLFLPIGVDGAMLAADSGGLGAGNIAANQDTAAAPQNETAIAVDPNNPSRIVGGANDYAPRTWTCFVGATPCSALGDAYSGTYYSNDGGHTWAANSSDPQHLGTLIPGVTRLAGGQYDAGGDPALAFDSKGNVYYAGLGFNRTSPPNTVAVNKGTFNQSGVLTWAAPTFINQTTSPSTLNDKEWIAADRHNGSRFQDRVYVSWTRYIFNPQNGAYVQSPIAFSYSADGGKTFSSPQLISGNVLYSQGSRPVVGYDGTVYVFWDGSTRLAQFGSTYMVKSTDGGVTWSKPVTVSTLADIRPLSDTAFRVNSFPAADVAPDGTLYVAWSTNVKDSAAPNTYGNPASLCADYLGCNVPNHSVAVYSKSTDGGSTWSNPAPIFPALDAQNRTPVGPYPVTQPDGGTLTPSVHRTDSLWPGVAVSPSGRVYMSAYVADVVSPWQSCAVYDPNGSINCLTPGNYVNNAKLNYYVTNIGSGQVAKVSAKAINTRYQFRGGFIGDYTGLAVGSDNVFHAFWTDTNVQQSATWWYGYHFNPPVLSNQQDVVTASGSF